MSKINESPEKTTLDENTEEESWEDIKNDPEPDEEDDVETDEEIFEEDDVETDEEADEEPDEETDEEADEDTDEDEDVEVTYNQQKIKLSKDEQVPLLQKGMNYDKVKERLDKTEADLQRLQSERQELAQLYGEDEETSLKSLRQQLVERRAEEEGITPDYLEKQMALESRLRFVEKSAKEKQVETEKEALRSKDHFNTLEADIDRLLESDPNWTVESAFTYLKGEKYEELREKEKSKAKKSTIANIQDRAKRGETKSGRKEKPTERLDPEIAKLAKNWGIKI